MVDGRPPTPVKVAQWFQRTWRGHWRPTPVLRRCFKRSRVRTGTPSSIGSEARRRSRPEPGESSSLWRCWPGARPFTRKVHAHPSSWPSITEQMAPNAGSAGQIPVQPASSDHTGERRTPLISDEPLWRGDLDRHERRVSDRLGQTIQVDATVCRWLSIMRGGHSCVTQFRSREDTGGLERTRRPWRLSTGGHARNRRDTEGHTVVPVRDREAPGSNPGPPTFSDQRFLI
jgi:hypothetical protein